MKKILILVLLVLFCSGSAFGGEFEDILKKAEQGDVDAQFFLGFSYQYGDHIKTKGFKYIQDYKKAVYWYTKAAEQGDTVSQNSLGELYHIGLGTNKDLGKAVHWYTKAAEKGNVDSQLSLGKVYFYGIGATPNYKMAAFWLTKAAEQGNADAQNKLGYMFSDGKGVPQDSKKAIYWYKKGAEQGDVWAQHNLGVAYQTGKGVPQDYKQAFHWYTKAAEQGHLMSQNNLGLMYVDGQGVPQDYKQAIYCFTKAAEQGVAVAQYNLSLMYYEGKGTTQNYKLTYVWESLAAAQGHESAIINRNITAKKLSSQQLSEAQDLAAQIQCKIDNPTKSQEQQSSNSNTERKINGSGTGFIITKDGYILTCHHVIESAREIKIIAGGNTYTAKLVRDDPNNDLALLKINGFFPAIAFSSKRSAKMGQEVFTIGFPNPGLQGVSAKFTEGTISSLTGFQDDLRLYQISLPIQPGNSGGALVNENGNILGVIMAMLDAKTTFKISGSMPQNVNYAVKSIYAQAMLDSLPEISNKLIKPTKHKTNALERVKKSTVMVLSYK